MKVSMQSIRYLVLSIVLLGTAGANSSLFGQTIAPTSHTDFSVLTESAFIQSLNLDFTQKPATQPHPQTMRKMNQWLKQNKGTPIVLQITPPLSNSEKSAERTGFPVHSPENIVFDVNHLPAAKENLNLYAQSLISTADADLSIEEEGKVNLVAGNEILLKHGFNITPGKNGAFNAWIQNPEVAHKDNSVIADEIETSGMLKVYPNPFAQSFDIDFELNSEGPVSLIIYDLSGKVVLSPILNSAFPMGQHQVKINAARLTKGVYIAKLTSAEKVKTTKLIKE